jgi:pyridoxine kinase
LRPASIVQVPAIDPEPPGSPGPGPHVISIQSQVVHGHVGNSAAVFPMQALGICVAAVPTTLLSNHPVYPTMGGRVLDAGLLEDLLRGVEERGLIAAASAILTGYLGSAENGAVVADFIARAKALNPDLLYVCDPVIGDEGAGIFVAPGILEVFRDRLVPLGSILTPNQFELEVLAGASARTLGDLSAAAGRLGRRLAVTGCALADTPKGAIETIVCEGGVAQRLATARLPIKPYGAGDLFAGLLTAHLVRGDDLLRAGKKAAAGVHASLRRTLALRSYELRLAAADFADPSTP